MKYNRIKKHYGAYNKELSWKITITDFIFQYLESKKDSFPQNLNWDTLLLLLSMIEYKVLTYIKSKGKKGYVDITSKELKSWRYDYNQYLRFLIDIGVISKKNYSTSKQQSNSYRINYEEIYNLGKGSIDITTIDIPLNKNINKLKDCNTPKLNSCIHLTKWLDSGFEFDIENFKSLGFNVELNEYEDRCDNSLRILSYLHKIEGIKNKEIRYSRNQDKDNRLHSHLTNFPSKLRGYLTYNGFDIMSYDLKNSQPFSLIVFIEGYMKGNNRIINIYNKIYNKSIMSPKLLEILSDKGFQDDYKIIKEWVLKGNFYEEISPYLDIEFEDNLYKIYEFNKQSESNKLMTFVNKRDAVKKLTLRLLYSPHKKDFKVFREFKNEFPKFWELLVILKSQTEHKNSYKLFPKLLQHIEADCLIDFVTKKIAEEYPNTPIFTIHDSICTIDTGTDSIYRLMMKYLAEYTGGILPTIKEEFWGLPITHPKAA